jgi:hypothetical protein
MALHEPATCTAKAASSSISTVATLWGIVTSAPRMLLGAVKVSVG